MLGSETPSSTGGTQQGLGSLSLHLMPTVPTFGLVQSGSATASSSARRLNPSAPEFGAVSQAKPEENKQDDKDRVDMKDVKNNEDKEKAEVDKITEDMLANHIHLAEREQEEWALGGVDVEGARRWM